MSDDAAREGQLEWAASPAPLPAVERMTAKPLEFAEVDPGDTRWASGEKGIHCRWHWPARSSSMCSRREGFSEDGSAIVVEPHAAEFGDVPAEVAHVAAHGAVDVAERDAVAYVTAVSDIVAVVSAEDVAVGVENVDVTIA